MPNWRSHLPTRHVSNHDGNTDPQTLEAGLAHQDSHITEESEDISEAYISEPTYDPKDTTSYGVADRRSQDTSSTHPNDTQVENAEDTVHGQIEPVASNTPHRKWSVTGFLKRPRASTLRGNADQSTESHNDGHQTDEKLDKTISHQTNSLSRTKTNSQPPPEYREEAKNLVDHFTVPNNAATTQTRSGEDTPDVDRHVYDIDYVPTPAAYKPGVFGAILSSRLNDMQQQSSQQRQDLTNHSQTAEYLDLARKYVPKKHQRWASHDISEKTSGTATPTRPKWYEEPKPTSSLANMLVHAGISSTGPAVPETSSIPRRPNPQKHASMIATAVDMIQHGGRQHKTEKREQNYDVVAEVADIIARRRYLIKICGAFMQYGAPTHRIEEYLAASARALLIDAQFMYIPGAMMCTFIDSTIQSNSVELVRKPEGLDFGRLKDVFNIYKLVIHGKFTAEDGLAEIENIRKRPDPYGVWFRIFVFGMASVIVGPFSFSSRPIDFPPIFLMGCALGFLQLKVVPRSEQFSNVFEVFSCVLSAFIARGLGSIRWGDGSYIFCFSAVAQSSIAMILPGFMVLNSALELQGRSIVAGSVRMVYAIIYVLFLGFGLLVGTTVFGLIKRDATADVTCAIPAWFSPAGNHWKLIYTRFIWAPMFACCVGLIYRAKWRQLPVMALIAACGHQANFWISTQLSSNLQVANAVGAFVIGCMANLYSRLFHGLAAAAMLPAIYCQVPGGLASSGSLVAGINSSNQIFGNSSSISVINNGTQGFVAAQNDPSAVYGGTIFNVGYGMVQVAIGISVGLYLSALVVYPYGKRNSGLFSF